MSYKMINLTNSSFMSIVSPEMLEIEILFGLYLYILILLIVFLLGYFCYRAINFVKYETSKIFVFADPPIYTVTMKTQVINEAKRTGKYINNNYGFITIGIFFRRLKLLSHKQPIH